MFEYLSNKSCEFCGYTDYRALEFDHIDPKTKTIGISKAVSDTWSWENILNEIEKCQILCANCHKVKTAKEQGWYKNEEDQTA
jgi:5-methylcytosine-specific restriction endonuclease McrA